MSGLQQVLVFRLVHDVYIVPKDDWCFLEQFSCAVDAIRFYVDAARAFFYSEYRSNTVVPSCQGFVRGEYNCIFFATNLNCLLVTRLQVL